jgi:hypothetical protein
MYRYLIKNLDIIVVSPFIINFFINLLNEGSTLSSLRVLDIFYGFICFIFLLSIGNLVSILFSLNSKTFGVILYYLSFFGFNYTTLYFDQFFFSFYDYFILINIFWLLLFILKRVKFSLFQVAIPPFIYVCLTLFRDSIKDRLKYLVEFKGDVDYFWFPMTKMIYENDLFYALVNNIEFGYGLLINHIHSINYLFFIGGDEYIFYNSTSNIYIFFSIALILEQNIKIRHKVLFVALFISIVVNSEWLTYLFYNSLMGETVVNILFPIIVLRSIGLLYLEKNINLYVVFLISFVYLSKPFVSILILLVFAVKAFYTKKISYLVVIFSGVIINLLNYKFVLKLNTSNTYFNSTELGTLSSILDYEYLNIYLIFENIFLKDKILTLILLLFICLFFWRLSSGTVKTYLPHIIIFINIGLVVGLYATVWSNRELESSYRYIFSIITLFILVIGQDLADVTKKK